MFIRAMLNLKYFMRILLRSIPRLALQDSTFYCCDPSPSPVNCSHFSSLKMVWSNKPRIYRKKKTIIRGEGSVQAVARIQL